MRGYAETDNAGYSALRKLERALKLDMIEVLATYRERRHYDLVVSMSEKAGIPLALALQLTRQDLPHFLIAHKLTSGSKTRLLRMLDLNRAFAGIICVSQAQVNQASQIFNIQPERIHFVYDKVDQHFFQPQDSPPGDFILAVGQEQRDYPTLLNAVSGTGLKLIVVASSPWSTSEIDLSQIDAEVELRHHIPFTELRALYDAARLVVVPLRPVDYAAGVNALLEAMAMAKPVILTRTSGITGYIEDQASGLYVNPGDPLALREHIRALWDDTAMRQRLGENARQRVETTMNMDSYVKLAKSYAAP